MSAVLWVAAGGAVGSAARYLVGVAIPVRPGSVPWGTFVANVTGALILGFLAGYFADRLSENARLALATGLLGGYTTFSSWALDSVELARAGNVTAAFTNVGVSLVVGLVAAAVGLAAGLALKPA
ncbi:MAG: fluoride efflux transporter CrcB [Acidimicrobiia bacterium]|nr:fluoride efflux transporter CrcB [Acidimicrobiia bacterium]